jgi:hypothetical protein
MLVQIGQFSKVTSVRVLPDRGSWAVCDGLLSVVTSQKRTSARSHRNPVIQYRRGTTRTGELDGTKNARLL